MGLLNGTTAYLAGPVERDINCASWRNQITPKLKSLGVKIWDPLVKPKWLIDEIGDLTALDQMGDKETFNEWLFNPSCESRGESFIFHRNKFTRDACLRLVSACDFVICYVDGPTVGTFEELCVANQQNKPILFFYTDQKLDSCWRYVQFSGAEHLVGIDGVIKYLTQVDCGESVDRIKWIFLNGGWGEN